jgi:hypothetical protein
MISAQPPDEIPEEIAQEVIDEYESQDGTASC